VFGICLFLYPQNKHTILYIRNEQVANRALLFTKECVVAQCNSILIKTHAGKNFGSVDYVWNHFKQWLRFLTAVNTTEHGTRLFNIALGLQKQFLKKSSLKLLLA